MKRPKYKEKYTEALDVLDSVLDTLQKGLELTQLSSYINWEKDHDILEKRIENSIKQIELYQSKGGRK